MIQLGNTPSDWLCSWIATALSSGMLLFKDALLQMSIKIPVQRKFNNVTTREMAIPDLVNPWRDYDASLLCRSHEFLSISTQYQHKNYNGLKPFETSIVTACL